MAVMMKILDYYKRTKTARRIAKDKLQEVLSDGNARIYNIFKNSEVDFPVEDGVEYQVRIYAYYVDRDKERKKIEILDDVDDVDDGEMWSRVKYGFVNAGELRAWEREQNSGAK